MVAGGGREALIEDLLDDCTRVLEDVTRGEMVRRSKSSSLSLKEPELMDEKPPLYVALL
jgi:hypothetical protein